METELEGGVHAYTRTRIRAFDPDALAEVIQGGAFDHRLIGKGTLAADIDHWHGGGLCIDRGAYGFPTLVEGEFRPGHLCFGLVASPSGAWINGSRILPADMQVHPEGAELLYRAGADTTWVGIQVTRERLQAAALEKAGRALLLPDSGSVNLALAPGVADSLGTLVSSVLRDAREGDAGRLHAALVLDGLAEALAQHGEPVPALIAEQASRRTTAIRRALRWMRTHLTTGYDSEALCSAIGVPERTLQLYFRQCLGSSPSRVHTYVRLHEARRLLVRSRGRARDSVTSTATRCGFYHLSRFTEQYRRLFHERPSETRAGHPVDAADG